MTTRLVSVYRSSRVSEMYLYVDRGRGLAAVPDDLRARFGVAELVFTMPLGKQRSLARLSVSELVDHLDRQGFYLQLPPPPVVRSESGVRADYVPLRPSDRHD